MGHGQREAHDVLVLIVFSGEKVGVPSVFQGAPIDFIRVLCRPDTLPAARTILQLPPLLAAAMHLPVAQPSETRGSGSTTTLFE